ncbi:MAG: ABC transporter ATP-binding protein [Fastidiosipilaceae bacterium]
MKENSCGDLSTGNDPVKSVNHALAVDNLRKTFSDQSGLKLVLSDISFVVDEGEIVSLVGPSGCGKSTLLHVLAGFDTDFQGSVKFAGQAIAGPSIERGMIFQTPQLFSWLSVEDNIGFGLKRAGVPKEERQILVNEFLRGVGMEEYRSYYPSQLSGGMRQRTALARTLIMKPSLILMDEPFSALDYPARLEMQQLTLDL